MRFLALLLIAALLAGCVTGGGGDPTTTTGHPSSSEATFSLVLDQSDLRAGSDWLIVEISPAADGQLVAHTNFFKPFYGPAVDAETFVCSVVGLGGTGLYNYRHVSLHTMDPSPVLGPVGHLNVGASGAPQHNARVTSANARDASMHLAAVKEGNSTFLFFGLRQQDVASGTTLALNLTGSNLRGEPLAFTHRIAGYGKMQCGGSVRDFGQGKWTETPYAIQAEGLRQGFRFDAGAVIWTKVRANGGFAAQVVGPLGTVWKAEERSTLTEGGSPLQAERLVCAGPGDWALEVPQFMSEGYQAGLVEYVALDLPPIWQAAFNCAGKAV